MTPPRTVAEALDAAARALAGAGIEAPRREARLLVGHALGLSREAVFAAPGRRLGAAEADALEALVARRAAREPAAYILGEREFWSLSFLVTRDTLIPRPESETVVEAALAAVADAAAPLRLLDLGTGSGCLLLALLSELPRAAGVGTDSDPAALGVARANARRLGFADRAFFVCADWGRGLASAFDLIVVNPPYVGDREAHGLAREIVDYEPYGAVFSGPDPLAAYRALVPDLARLLAAGGTAVIELAAGQADAVRAIIARGGLAIRGSRRDLGGVERCLIVGRRDGAEKCGNQENFTWNERPN